MEPDNIAIFSSSETLKEPYTRLSRNSWICPKCYYLNAQGVSMPYSKCEHCGFASLDPFSQVSSIQPKQSSSNDLWDSSRDNPYMSSRSLSHTEHRNDEDNHEEKGRFGILRRKTQKWKAAIKGHRKKTQPPNEPPNELSYSPNESSRSTHPDTELRFSEDLLSEESSPQSRNFRKFNKTASHMRESQKYPPQPGTPYVADLVSLKPSPKPLNQPSPPASLFDLSSGHLFSKKSDKTPFSAAMDGAPVVEKSHEAKRRRREDHNNIERRRRDNINEAIRTLHSLIPRNRFKVEE